MLFSSLLKFDASFSHWTLFFSALSKSELMSLRSDLFSFHYQVCHETYWPCHSPPADVYLTIEPLYCCLFFFTPECKPLCQNAHYQFTLTTQLHNPFTRRYTHCTQIQLLMSFHFRASRHNHCANRSTTDVHSIKPKGMPVVPKGIPILPEGITIIPLLVFIPFQARRHSHPA